MGEETRIAEAAVARKRSAPDTSHQEGVRWDVMASDIRALFLGLPRRFRNDSSAVMLVVANIYPVIEMALEGEPVGSILVIYWIQLMIIGFWNVVKLVAIARWKALLIVPMFLAMYLSVVNFFGIVAGALLDDQMRDTAWLQQFSLWNYWVPATLFFASHGLSFWQNFIRGREYRMIKWDAQMGKPILRAMPMWMAAIAGAFIGGWLGSAAVAVLFVLPVKLSLDLVGHFTEHRRLSADTSA